MLPRLFDDVTQSLREPITAKKAELICVCEADKMMGQEDLLRSLLLNLIVNALKACPESGGIICLKAKQEAGQIILSVTDSGCGIPNESLAKVTEPFYRVDKARSREYGGIGLGLSLCRQIALAHSAELHIASTPGQGTKVSVNFTAS